MRNPAATRGAAERRDARHRADLAVDAAREEHRRAVRAHLHELSARLRGMTPKAPERAALTAELDAIWMAVREWR